MKIILLILILLVVSGCSEMNSQFDCPMKPGIRCESIDSINTRVDRGEISAQNTANTSIQPVPVYKASSISQTNYTTAENLKRHPETVQRLWIAPFEDKEGNYHQESDIYTVVKPGSWVGSPLKTTNAAGE